MSIHNPRCRRRRIGPVVLATLAAMATATSAAYASGDRSGKAPAGGPTRVSGAAARALASSAAAASAPQTLGGFTSQGWPAVVDFSKNHKQIRLVEAGLEMKCASGTSFSELDGWTRLAIPANGRVHVSSPIPPQTGTNASLTGGTDTFSGQFNRQRTRLTGTWELRQTFSLPNGQTDQCDSGPVGFALVV
jgi:hypothetical protein